MFVKYMPVNIRLFDEGDDEENYFVDGEFDVDKFRADFEKEIEAEETEDTDETTEETTEESETDPETDVEEETETEEEETEETETEESPSFDSQKQNEAFAKMRNQLQEEKKLSEFVRKLADQQGISPEQLMDAYRERQLEAEAKEQNVPVDVLKRIKTLEEENKTAKQGEFATKFDNEVKTTREKYSLDDNGVQKVIDYMAQNGYVNPDNTTSISFEDAYILANKDEILNQAKDQGRQEYLKEKKQKQKQSTVPVSGTSTTNTETGDFSREDIVKQFREMGLDNPFE